MTLLYYHPEFLEHDTGKHPECADRIIPAARRLNLLAMHMGCSRPSWTPLSAEELGRIHNPDYVGSVQRMSADGGGMQDSDTVLSTRSYDVARLAAGAACDAVDNVLTGQDQRAFCLVRPPGHHAKRSRAMGFCLFNNVALAAQRSIDRHGLEKVLIVDWDVHHGNGTQEIFWEDPRVGYFSIHRHPFYPGTGALDETGGGAGLGTKLNVPIEFGTSRADYLQKFRQGVERLAARIQPQLVLVSAGFDAHRLDPIGSLGLEGEDFAPMTQVVLDIAATHAGGRVVSILEGGYNPSAVAECVERHVQQLFSS
jgi:acetoin utilization deacetylase AcuC-like enzyme